MAPLHDTTPSLPGALFIASVALLLYGIPEKTITKHVDLSTLGNTEDGRPYIYRKPGHQHEYSTYELCKDDGRLEVFKADECGQQLALARFKNAVNSTGWAFLEIETNGEQTPFEQAYAAGYLEGTLTRKLIEHQLHNVLSNFCTGKEEYCEKLREFVKENQAWTQEFLTKTPTEDPYYSAIHRTYYQLQGLIDAYERRRPEVHASFEFHQIVFLNWLGEFYDLEVKFNNTRAGVDIPEKCSALVKLAPDNQDLFFAHVTMFAYNQMLRVIKLYKFGYDQTAYPGHTISFTGYPGVIASQDDFHLTSSKIAVMETTIGVYDQRKMEHTKPVGQFPCWLRSMTASLLADSANGWVEIFMRHHMGTYNNQWMIVDYKLFEPGHPLKENTFWVLETMPGFHVARDKSAELQSTTYHPSYNLPHEKEIVEYSALEKFARAFDKTRYQGIGGDYYRPGKSPRAKIFARDHHKATDFESFTKLLRSINYKNDELSRCNCDPPYSGEAAIAARGDLNDPNGRYEFAAIGHRNHGAIDFKGINYERAKKFSFRAWGAPAWDEENEVPVFEWSDFERRSPIRGPHRGHPDRFDFEHLEVEWEANLA
ncbi:unnamed protein product, partial [Mesorhabditis spiculigera]